MDQKTQKTILAVDDNVTQLNIFKAFLNSRYKLSLVKSASDALRLMDRMNFDLILLDIEMPDISGFEFLHVIRKKPMYITKPVIIVSSHTEPDFLAHAEKSSASCLLTKPVEVEELIMTIEKTFAAPPKNPFGI